MGKMMKLDVAFTGSGSSAAILTPNGDDIDVKGTLLLVDAVNSRGSWSAGAPADNAVLTNLVKAQAAQVMGVSATGLDVTQRVVNMTGSAGKVERTPRGALHAIQSLTQTTGSQGYQAQIPLPIITFMKANPSHVFYVSVWNKPTLVGTGALDMYSTAAESGAYAYVMGGGDAASGTIIGSNSAGRGTVNVPACSVQAVTSLTTAFVNATTVAGRYGLFETGNFSLPNSNASLAAGKHGARAYYRGYIEDLTISGRSYATVLGLDTALFAAAFGVGGKYYQDSVPTDPSTIP